MRTVSPKEERNLLKNQPSFDLAHKMQRLALDTAWRVSPENVEQREWLTRLLREHGLDVWRLLSAVRGEERT